MTKRIFLFFVSISIFISCEKENVDNVKPIVKILQPLPNDTIHLSSTYPFRATFWDDKGLSSYFIQVSNPAIDIDDRVVVDPADSTKRDSLLYLDQVIQRVNIFDIKDTVVTVEHSFILDSLGYIKNRGPFNIVRGIYQFKVVVMDKAGNRDSSYFNVYVAPPIPD